MPSIAVDRLTKTFSVPEKDPGLWGSLKALVDRRTRDVRAVEGVSFNVEPGELVGFLGANGAGKTTTLKMLSGLLHPTSGTASVLGYTPWNRETAFQKQFSLVMGQRSQLWWEIAAQESFKLNQKIYELSDADYERSLGELTELLDLKDCLPVPVKKLSLGQRMRAELAVALLHRPKLLLLDEPTLGLDVVMQKRVRQFVSEYNRRNEATILLTSHNMDDVVELCPRVIIIEKGRILYDGSLKKVVETYATHKIISADFTAPVSKADLGELGTVTHNGDLRAVIEVPRKDVSRLAAELLRRFPVSDLTIEETPLDEVVRKIFHTDMNALLSKYGTVYSLSLQDVLQRRASLLMDRIGGLAYITALYFFWDALLRGQTSFLGYSRAQMLSYVLAMDVLRSFVLSSRGWELVHEIASGKLSRYLLRPVSYLGYSLALDMAQKTAHLAAALLEVSFLIFLFSAPLYIPRDPWTWVLFAVSVMLSSLLYFLLEFLVSSLAFWTSESGGPLFCLTLFMEFAAGVFFPIDVLPRWAQNILYATPFPYLVFSPISIYLERASQTEALKIFAIQIAWLAVFYVVLQAAWRRGLQNYSAEGG